MITCIFYLIAMIVNSSDIESEHIIALSGLSYTQTNAIRIAIISSTEVPSLILPAFLIWNSGMKNAAPVCPSSFYVLWSICVNLEKLIMNTFYIFFNIHFLMNPLPHSLKLFMCKSALGCSNNQGAIWRSNYCRCKSIWFYSSFIYFLYFPCNSFTWFIYCSPTFIKHFSYRMILSLALKINPKYHG